MEYQSDYSFNESINNIDHISTIIMNSNTNLSTIITTTTTTTNNNDNICNQQQNSHNLVSTNSFELKSLSDDSGLPHTNSSISSGSSRGLCKFEFELAESEGEVSQFDSLDNCSDGGMSTENFNTLKKVPIIITTTLTTTTTTIDPPPEFQDSTIDTTLLLRTKLIENYAIRLTKTIISSAYIIYTQLPYYEQYEYKLLSSANSKASSSSTQQQQQQQEQENCSSNLYFQSKFINKKNYDNNDDDDDDDNADRNFINRKNTLQMYSSDSILNQHYYNYDNNNIYDEPNCDNTIITTAATKKIITTNTTDDICKIIKKTIKKKSHNLISEIKKFDNSNYKKSSNKNNLISSTSEQQSQHHHQQQTSKTILYSPLHHHHPVSNLSTINRQNSRNSLNSRLSSSHNSLSIITGNKADDSIFITQAMSHDEITDFYNVPIDSDIYSLPIDVIKPSLNLTQQPIVTITNKSIIGTGITGLAGGTISDCKNFNKNSNNKSKLKYTRNNNNKKRRRNNCLIDNNNSTTTQTQTTTNNNNKYKNNNNNNKLLLKTNDKRHSVPENTIEPMHMTLDEVKRYYHSLYSSSSESLDTIINKNYNNKKNSTQQQQQQQQQQQTQTQQTQTTIINNNKKHKTLNNKLFKTPINFKSSIQPVTTQTTTSTATKHKLIPATTVTTSSVATAATTATNTINNKKSQFSINLNLKQKFCSIFRFRKSSSSHNNNNHNNMNNNNNINNKDDCIEYTNTTNRNISGSDLSTTNQSSTTITATSTDNNEPSTNNKDTKKVKFFTRALPPLPAKDGATPEENKKDENVSVLDFPANIEKVKECGWYWGPISSEAAEKILSNEPDGSFIVRDSSDDHYIFSLTFKLSGCIRHVRIEQDQGEFSFGSRALFKSRTITEFIENAVEHSRSGRYLFFLHRRPEHGPLRVQLTNPVSRFRHIQSLQHMCRFAILKAVVRKDLIQTLPLPRRLLDYLSYKNCYSEQIDSDSSQSQDLEPRNEINR